MLPGCRSCVMMNMRTQPRRQTMPHPTILRLSDTDLVLSQPDEDVRGRKVIDADGNDIGHVDDLMIDDREKKVRFLRVASGGFLGIGRTKVLIPVDVIQKITRDTVQIDRTREHVAGSPP